MVAYANYLKKVNLQASVEAIIPLALHLEDVHDINLFIKQGSIVNGIYYLPEKDYWLDIQLI